MQRIDGRFIYAASDLNNYLECKRLTELDALVARGQLDRPPDDDEQAELIRRKGDEHEKRYLAELQSRHGDGVVRFERSEQGVEAYRDAERRTLEAMKSSVSIVYQATFFDGRFIGHADFLRRVETPSKLGGWSYEVLDTKLALSSKSYFLIQLCNYSEHLERLQGLMPRQGHIVLGDGSEEHYRLHDYLAYYRHLKATFLAFAGDPTRAAAADATQFPFKIKHCSICPWDDACTQKRERDDHLSLVAWMRRDQIARFEEAGIASVKALANASAEMRPEGMSEVTFGKLRRQAGLQVRGRESGEAIYELLEHAPPMGFALLPEPAAGDVFFDMEGDPLFEPGHVLEYLFGGWLPDDDPHFRAFWALERAEEKRAFEEFVDFIIARRRAYPALHVYHYAPYEKVALRRLAQVYCTREDEVDVLLRGEVLVDLYAVVRQTLAISEDGYGLKKLERFYDFVRGTDIKKGDQSIVEFERWLQSGDRKILDDIEAYNRDDCRSTYLLRQWLLARRLEANETLGLGLAFRPVKSPDEPCHAEFQAACTKCVTRRNDEREEERRSELERTLLRDVLPPQTDDEYRAMSEDRRARYLLANLLAYHRREEKPAWWEYFDRCENIDRLQEYDREAIGELKLREDVAPFKRSPKDRSLVYTYAFPDQHHKLGESDAPHDPLTKKAGTIVKIDEDGEENVLQFKWGGDLDSARAVIALIPGSPPPTAVQRKALKRIAESFVAGSLESEHPATLDLLTSRNPRIVSTGRPAGVALQPEHVTAESVSAVVRALDRSYLFIQGPPGSGKTTQGAAVICDLLQSGKRVGITSTGHKAIHHLLHKVEDGMMERGRPFRGLYKYTTSNAGSKYESRLPVPLVTATSANKDFEDLAFDLAAGTSWLFACEDLVDAFDYLFIDEAGQVSLADALAVSACAKNVVLLGDPSQLAQVGQGVQPVHAGDSVLQHLLGNAPTVPKHRGVFLDRSYRMQPEICAFISEAMYESRLEPDPDTALHGVTVAGARRAGLMYLPIEHIGNSSSSAEEADRIVREISRLREGAVVDSWPPRSRGIARELEDRDIIVVTPYNAQRRLIARKLKDAGIGVEVGTVDKFQGREAAVVFYSMATSSGEDMPRNMAFLFEKNRFNVAVSRARALSVLVCSPRLLDIACRTPEQMALANLLCAFAERAHASERL
ncbi:MAG: TM0106 family RecB-like putative nuclease [Candidatus Tumulicola sp.]